MKRTILIGIIIGIAAVTSVTAQGFYGGRCDGIATGSRNGGPGMIGGARGTTTAEAVELTGRLQLAAGELPTLVSSGTTYVLRVHPALIEEIEVSTGETIQVEGELIEVKNPDLVSTDRVVFVRVFQSDGTRYVAPDRPAFAGAGDRTGTMGRRGYSENDFDDDRRSPRSPRRW